MPDDKSPPEDRLEAAASYFVALGGKMHHMAEQVRKLVRDRERLQMELLDTEQREHVAVAVKEDLEDDIEGMRLGLLTPEEVIERVGRDN